MRKLRSPDYRRSYKVKASVKTNQKSIEAYLTNTFGFVTIKNIQNDVFLVGNNKQHELESALRYLLMHRLITRLNLGARGWVYGTD